MKIRNGSMGGWQNERIAPPFDGMPDVVTRFAPSPTGLLHPGHAYSALSAWKFVRENGGRFLLRIEDIDFTRCRPEYESTLFEDLAWLGIEWEEPVRKQSEHLRDFQQTEAKLDELGVLYPCFCTRKEILAEIEESGGAPHGSEGPLYPGTCRDLSADERSTRIARGDSFATRLNLDAALEITGTELRWKDLPTGEQNARPRLLGDAVLVRKDIHTSYHLAVTTDDALQGITHVVRGLDLYESTHLHRVLQELLHFPVPVYSHHDLIRDADGKRLAKRDESITIRSLRESGKSADEFKRDLGFHF